MTEEYVSDHEPLRLREIIDLLEEARADRASSDGGDYVKRARIQNRLRRGIVGSTCPIKEYGPAARAWAELGRLYVSFLKDPGQSVDDIAVDLYGIMKTE